MDKKIKIIEIQNITFEVEQTEIESFLDEDDLAYYEEYEAETLEGFNHEVDLDEFSLDSITFNKDVVINDTKYLKGDKLENIIILDDEKINSQEQAQEYIDDLLFRTIRGVNPLSDTYNDIYENYLRDNLPSQITNDWNLIEADEEVELEYLEINENDFTIN